MERPRLGLGSLDRWLTSRFPKPHEDPALLRVFAQRGKPRQRSALDHLGAALWAVLCDHHRVTVATGQDVDLGSFRCAGAILADWLNRTVDDYWFSEHDFYLAGIGVIQMSAVKRERATERFSLIFERLHAFDDDWTWSDQAHGASGLPPPLVAAYHHVYGQWPNGFSASV